MSDFSNGFGAIFRQAFVGKRGNLADALFAIADAIQELGSRPTQHALDKVPVRLGDACPKCGGCDVQCAECLAALCQ